MHTRHVLIATAVWSFVGFCVALAIGALRADYLIAAAIFLTCLTIAGAGYGVVTRLDALMEQPSVARQAPPLSPPSPSATPSSPG
jgi:hypothetical protein